MSVVPFADLSDLRSDATSPTYETAEYTSKMMHALPKGMVVDRARTILMLCKDQVVLHVGASGMAHQGIQRVAQKTYGLDLNPEHTDTAKIDLDEVGVPIPVYGGVTRIVCGEILEHLGNPRHMLDRLRAAYPGVLLIITAPNAMSYKARHWIERGIENVNIDHVAWYSFHTLKGLLGRSGYDIRWLGWYDGPPGTAEGLIVVAG